VVRGITKPHAFSWVAWGALEVVAFLAQLSAGGGYGAWITAASAVVVIFIAIKSFGNTDKYITKVDFVALAGAGLGIVLWRITHNPLLATIFVTLADACAFIPTFRKAFHKPNEETLFEYSTSAVKWGLSIFPLGSLNLTTVLYPASLVITNSIFVIMTSVRRKQI